MIEIDEQQFIKALNEVAATDQGKIALACLKEYCKFDGDILSENSPENTYANATLRRAYLYLRNRIRPEHLKKIEFDYQRKVNNERSSRSKSKSAKSTKSA